MNKFIILSAIIMLAGCGGDDYKSSGQIEAERQEIMSKQAVQAVGMPAIVNFAEKRMMKDILELRDQNVPTITYTEDVQGRLHKRCDSVGYGLPYSTQYTNPMARAGIPQADPNGLFSPAAAEGTWVLCLNPATKKVQPVYFEPRVIVTPFTMDEK